MAPAAASRGTRERYLQWFKPTRAYRFRRAVPTQLRPIIGQSEWTETLSRDLEGERFDDLEQALQEAVCWARELAASAVTNDAPVRGRPASRRARRPLPAFDHKTL